MTDYIKREDAIRIARTQGKKAQFDGMAQDVAPVRHGRWKLNRSGRGANCSRCDMWMPFTMLPYCPHCGAKMDEEEKI